MDKKVKLNTLKRFIFPLVQWRYQPWARTRWKMRPAVTLWQGHTIKTGQPMTIVYAGEYRSRAAYWVNLMLAENRQKHDLGNQWLSALPSLLKNKYPEASLLIVEKTLFAPLFPFLSRGFLIPYWVQMEIDISKPLDQMSIREKEGFFDIERRIRKYNLSCEFTNDPKHMEEFFHSMHTPFIRNRHEEESFYMDIEHARKIFKNAFLCLVKKDGEILGGSVVQTGRRHFLRLIGLKDGNMEYIKYGILGAAYYFAIKRLQEEGHTVLDIGGGNPVLNSGLTRFKSFLKGKVIPYTSLRPRFLHLIPLRSSPALSEVFSNLQILYHPKYFHPLRAIFVDASELNNKEAVCKKLTSKSPQGIRGTEVYILGNYRSEDAAWIKQEESVVSVQSINSRLLFP